MKRFQALVKKKIIRKLSEDEAKELHVLSEQNKRCSLLLRLLFEQPAGINDRAEKAFAAHRRKLQPVKKKRTR